MRGTTTETRGSHQRDNRLKIERGSAKFSLYYLILCFLRGLFSLFFFPLLTQRHTKAGLAELSLSLALPHTPHSPFHVQKSLNFPASISRHLHPGRERRAGTEGRTDGRTHARTRSCEGIVSRLPSQRQTQQGKELKKKTTFFLDLYAISGNQRFQRMRIIDPSGWKITFIIIISFCSM